ncbi:MAG: hypothetical protein Q4D40_00345 [Eubacteriales bacterium]|nr:hypothetical protein [Eubacteriales bacterium]
MKRIMKHDPFVRIAALSMAMLLLLTDSVYAQNVSTAAAAGKNTVDSTQQGADVEEKLYVNMDSSGRVTKANVVKGINFSTGRTYTDYGSYKTIVNMTDSQEPAAGKDYVTWERPEKGGKLYFQGELEPENIKLPWSFEVSYKVNGVPVTAENAAGASGVVEIDIDAIPDRSVSKYMQDNYMLMVLIPMDSSEVYSTDAPGSMEASFGNYSGLGFEALPGQEKHFEARIGTECFESMGVMMIMTPVTVSDLEKVRDLKEIEDKYRDNTNAMLDSMEAIMDNVSDMSSQLERTNQVLDELAGAKSKIDANRTIIFNGVDLSLQEVRDLTALMEPLDASARTAQWMVYDLNQKLNNTNNHIQNVNSVMGTLSKKLRSLSTEMASTNTYSIDSIAGDLELTQTALDELMASLLAGGIAVENLKAVTGSADFENGINNAGIENAKISAYDQASEYLPAPVIAAVNLAYPDLNAVTVEMLPAMQPQTALLLDIYSLLSDPGATGRAVLGVSGTDIIGFSNASLPALIEEVTREKIAAGKTPAVAQAEAEAQVGARAAAIAQAKADLQTGSAPTTITAASAKKAENFISSMRSMLQLKTSLKAIENGSYGSSGASIRQNLDMLSGATSQALINGAAAYATVNFEDMIALLDSTSSDIDDVMSEGASVSYQTSRLLDSLRKTLSDVDALTGVMNTYYGDIQTALGNMSNITESAERTSKALTDTLQILNDTLRSASENLSNAGDLGISAGKDAVSNMNSIVDNTKDLKEAGADLRKTINDELDKEEAEHNFLNMDPNAEKESLTSRKNKEPKTVQIICRTDEIKADDNTEPQITDAELPEVKQSFGERVINIFRRILNRITGK